MVMALLSLLMMMVIRTSGTLLGWLIKWIKQKWKKNTFKKNHLRGLVELVDQVDKAEMKKTYFKKITSGALLSLLMKWMASMSFDRSPTASLDGGKCQDNSVDDYQNEEW